MLRHKDRLILTQLAEINEPLYHAYLLKEQLRGIVRYPWKYLGSLRRRLDEWVEVAHLKALPEVVKVADCLKPHLEAVVAGHRHDIKLGVVEAINSEIGALGVQARGYSDPEYFKLEIFQRCGLVDNPWAQVIL